MNTTKSNLPSRLREPAFKRYEEAIQSIVARFPEVTVFDKGNLVTFSARLRDAMASLVLYRWTTDKVDMDKFDEHYPQIKVSHVMPDRVVVGSAENIKRYYQSILPPSELESFTTSEIATAKQSSAVAHVSEHAMSNAVVSVPLATDTHDRGIELKLLARLAAERLLTQQVQIQIQIDAEQAEWLEQSFDVVLNKVNDGLYTLS